MLSVGKSALKQWCSFKPCFGYLHTEAKLLKMTISFDGIKIIKIIR